METRKVTTNPKARFDRYHNVARGVRPAEPRRGSCAKTARVLESYCRTALPSIHGEAYPEVARAPGELQTHFASIRLFSDLVLDVCRTICARCDCHLHKTMEEAAKRRRPGADSHGPFGVGPAPRSIGI